MNFKSLFFIFFLIPFLAQAQSPWTPGNGNQYHQLSFTTVPSYNQLYVDDGTLEIDRFVTDNTLQYYSEFGIGDKFSIVGVLPLKMIKVGKQTDEQVATALNDQNYTNLSDIQIALKYNFLRKGNFAFGASLLASLPTAGDEGLGVRSGFGELHLRPSLSAGVSQEKYYSYLFVSYNWFQERIDPSLYWGLEFGYKITPSFIIAAQISSIKTLADLNKNLTAANVGAGLYENGFEYSAVLIKLIKEFVPEKFGMTASIGGGNGNLVAQAPALTLGAYFKIFRNQE